MVLDKADDEENRRHTFYGMLRLVPSVSEGTLGVQHSIKPFIAFVSTQLMIIFIPYAPLQFCPSPSPHTIQPA